MNIKDAEAAYRALPPEKRMTAFMLALGSDVERERIRDFLVVETTKAKAPMTPCVVFYIPECWYVGMKIPYDVCCEEIRNHPEEDGFLKAVILEHKP